jgi:small subunit ribosomal protein S1
MDQSNLPPVPPPPAGSPDRAALDADLEREIQEALGDMRVEDMVPDRPTGGRAAAAPRNERSNVRTGTVVRVHDGEVFIEFDPKRQGVCPVAQFEQPPAPGERFEFVEERFDPFEQLWVVRRPGATHKGDLDSLSAGMIVEARCVGMNKGGLDMEVAHHKAFMPAGRMVLSRKAVQLEERARSRDKVLGEIEVGQTRTATITSIQQYGAFADLGGVDGLIHVSDLSHERIKDPSEVVKVGDVVEVRVLRVDREAKPPKIALGRKQTLSDPALTAIAEIQAGATVTGKVTKLTEFGAFVELSPGVEGLVHVSECAHERIPTPAKVLTVGEVLQLKVLSVDLDRKRISLSRKALLDRPAMPASGGDRGGKGPAPAPMRADDPVMRKLRAKFAGNRELKGGLG